MRGESPPEKPSSSNVSLAVSSSAPASVPSSSWQGRHRWGRLPTQPRRHLQSWSSNPLLPGDNPDFAIGANGIAYRHRTIYVMNYDLGAIISIAVEPDGSAGPARTYARGSFLMGRRHHVGRVGRHLRGRQPNRQSDRCPQGRHDRPGRHRPGYPGEPAVRCPRFGTAAQSSSRTSDSAPAWRSMKSTLLLRDSRWPESVAATLTNDATERALDVPRLG
jgi:hypothetical protein